ncbi:MAG: NADH-quinone oxidoreductase subunit L [Acidobacteriaceae bacterium]
MAHLLHLWLSYQAAVLCVPPLVYFLMGLGDRLVSKSRLPVWKAWSLARMASFAVLVFSLACCGHALWNASALTVRPQIASLFAVGNVQISFRFDLVESLMLLLVSFLGWVIVNYSCRYMAGDARERVYIGRLMHTLAAVTLLVVTNSMIVFLMAWVATGLALHGLLTLYPTRQAAVIAAHKKFLASRLGDVSLLGGVLLLGAQAGSFEMDRIADSVSKLQLVPLSIHLAALLLAVSAIIKCAQLPLHGWLIQVMEAPTPVSALLHAGIVNLGGFMLIRLAMVINTTEAAQALLVAVGCFTSVIASLVMTTRISIKVHLAWSTCAQMGFMLMECGLGLYALAFLHLLAHSLYKAYAFLSSGGTVNEAKMKGLTAALRAPGPAVQIAGGVCGLMVAALAEHVWRHAGRMDANAAFRIAVVGFAVAGLLAAVRSVRGLTGVLILGGTSFAVSVLYFGYDGLFQKVVPREILHAAQHPILLILALSSFSVLYGIQTMIRAYPLGAPATMLYPWFYAGLYLDEIFTRATFRLWPSTEFSKTTKRRDAMQAFEGTGQSL